VKEKSRDDNLAKNLLCQNLFCTLVFRDRRRDEETEWQISSGHESNKKWFTKDAGYMNAITFKLLKT
jgi:hypothetical protein